MTDKELKKNVKKLGIVILFLIIILIILSVYTLGSTKAELSIYEASEYSDNLKAIGVNEDEFIEYLSTAGFLVSEESDDVQALNMAVYFIDNMCSFYEVETNEEGKKVYDADLVHNVIHELNGQYIKENLDGKENYTYQKEQNVYVQEKEIDEIPCCITIDDIQKREDKIEVTYQLATFTTTELADYRTDKQIDFDTKTVKAIILNNTDYQYAKYFISEISK